MAPSFYDAIIAKGTTSTALVSKTAGIDVTNALQLLNGITTSGTAHASVIRLGSSATTAGSSTFAAARYIDGYESKAGAPLFYTL